MGCLPMGRRAPPPRAHFSMPDPSTIPPRGGYKKPKRAHAPCPASKPARYSAKTGLDAIPKPTLSSRQMAAFWERRDAMDRAAAAAATTTDPPGSNNNTAAEARRRGAAGVERKSARYLASAAKFDRAKVFQVDLTDEVAHAKIDAVPAAAARMERRVVDMMETATLPPSVTDGMAVYTGSATSVWERVHGLEEPRERSGAETEAKDPVMDSPMSIMQGAHMFRQERSAVRKVAGHYDDTDWDSHFEYKKIMEDVDAEIHPPAPIWPPRKCDM